MHRESIWGPKVNSTREIGEEDQNSRYYQTGSKFTIFPVWCLPLWMQCGMKPRLGTENPTEKLLEKASTSASRSRSAAAPIFLQLIQSCSCPKLTIRWHAYEIDVHKSAKSLKIELTLEPIPQRAGWTLCPEPNHVNCLLKQKCQHSPLDLSETKILMT